MSRLALPRLSVGPQRDDPCDEHGGWFLWHPSLHGATRDAWLMIKCPSCLKTAALREHQVGRDGSVTPSVVCPFAPCAFHEFIVLDAWPANWDKNAGYSCPAEH